LGVGLRPGKLSGGEIWRWFEKLSGLVVEATTLLIMGKRWRRLR
jgi:hypothetical protein